MEAKILDGKKVAEQILLKVREGAKEKNLKLAVVQVGENRVSEKYIKEKKRTAEKAGIEIEIFRFGGKTAQKELEREVERIGKDEKITGVIVQLPLPGHMNAQQVLDCIPTEKDVDVLSSETFKEFEGGKLSVFPPTVAAVQALLSHYGIEIKGKKVTLVGLGRLVGMPLSVWLQNEGVTVLVVDKGTKDIATRTREADIVISGVGKRNLITGDMVKDGVIVIDAGTSVEGGKTMGDVDFESVSKKAAYITPVPGGVGPLTVASLLYNMVLITK